MSAALSIDAWFDQVLKATEEFAEISFQSAVNDVSRSEELPQKKEGSVLPLHRGDVGTADR